MAPLPRTAVTTSTAVEVSPPTANNVHQRSSPATSSRRGPTVSAIVSYGAAAAAFHTIRVAETMPLSKQMKGSSHDVSSERESFAAVSPVEYAAALVEQLSLNGVSSRFPHRGLPPLSNAKHKLGKACSSTLSWSIQQDGLTSSSTKLPAPLSRSQLSDRSSAPVSTAVPSPNGRGFASVLDNIGGTNGQPDDASVPPSSTLSLYIPVIDASALNAEESLMPELLTYLRRAATNEDMMIIPVLLVDISSSSSPSAERYSKEALEVVAALRENCFVVDAALPPPTTTASIHSSIKKLELLSPDDVALKIMYLLDELRQVGEEADDRGSRGRVKFEAVPGQTLTWSVSSSHE